VHTPDYIAAVQRLSSMVGHENTKEEHDEDARLANAATALGWRHTGATTNARDFSAGRRGHAGSLERGLGLPEGGDFPDEAERPVACLSSIRRPPPCLVRTRLWLLYLTMMLYSNRARIALQRRENFLYRLRCPSWRWCTALIL